MRLARVRLFALATLAACGTPAPPVPPPTEATPTPTEHEEPAPASSAPRWQGTCAVLGPEEALRRSEAGCPDPTALARGDGLGTAEGLPSVAPSDLPPFDREGLLAAACAYACAPREAEVELLAWSIYEDDRPLRNHYAFALVVLPEGAPERWVLVAMYRHATNAWWNIDVSFHGTARPVARFDHAPTAAEVDALLADNEWDFGREGGWGATLLAGGVLAEGWRERLGWAPPYAYGTDAPSPRRTAPPPPHPAEGL